MAATRPRSSRAGGRSRRPGDGRRRWPRGAPGRAGRAARPRRWRRARPGCGRCRAAGRSRRAGARARRRDPGGCGDAQDQLLPGAGQVFGQPDGVGCAGQLTGQVAQEAPLGGGGGLHLRPAAQHQGAHVDALVDEVELGGQGRRHALREAERCLPPLRWKRPAPSENCVVRPVADVADHPWVMICAVASAAAAGVQNTSHSSRVCHNLGSCATGCGQGRSNTGGRRTNPRL
jgi:hypothetical protein